MQIENVSGCLKISGDVSTKTLTPKIYDEFVRQIGLPEISAVDFADVGVADSVCVSLLLTMRHERVSASLNILNLPESVRDLANLYGVEEWLNVA